MKIILDYWSSDLKPHTTTSDVIDYPSQVDQNTRIYDANGLLLSNLQYGQISTKLLYHAHLMETNPDHNPLYNIYMT